MLFDQRYGGVYSWHLPANFLVLRMISFACDEHWAARALEDEKKSDGVTIDTEDTGETRGAFELVYLVNLLCSYLVMDI